MEEVRYNRVAHYHHLACCCRAVFMDALETGDGKLTLMNLINTYEVITFKILVVITRVLIILLRTVITVYNKECRKVHEMEGAQAT